MSRALVISSRASDFLSKLQPKQFKQVVSAIFALLENPRPHDSIKLTGRDDIYRKTCGEYRVIYNFNSETINIEIVEKRNDDSAYRILNRKF